MTEGVIQVGSLVWATAGREKGSCYVAVGVNGGFVYIADGRHRRVSREAHPQQHFVYIFV